MVKLKQIQNGAFANNRQGLKRRESIRDPNPRLERRLLNDAHRNIASLEELYQKLELKISEIVLRKPQIKLDIRDAKKLTLEISRLESELVYSSNNRLATRFNPGLHKVPNESSELKQIELQERKIQEAQKKFSAHWLKPIVPKLHNVLDPKDPEHTIKNILKICDERTEVLNNGQYAQSLKGEIKKLHTYKEFYTRNDKLKFLAQSIGDRHCLTLAEKVELLASLDVLSTANPQYQEISREYPDFEKRCNDFYANLYRLRGVPGITETILSAAKILNGRDNMSSFVNRIYGFFYEAVFNVALMENGYIPLSVENIQSRQTRAILIDHNGNDLLEGVDFNEPQKALDQLTQRGLLDARKDNGNLVRFKTSSDSNMVIYFNKSSGEILFNKYNRTTAAPGIIIRQEDGAMSSFNLDANFKAPNGEELYLEHKINLSTFIKKNSSNSRKRYNQLRNLLCVAKAHATRPTIMMTFDEVKGPNGEIMIQHPLLKEAREIIGKIRRESPDLPNITILNERADDMTEYFNPDL